MNRIEEIKSKIALLKENTKKIEQEIERQRKLFEWWNDVDKFPLLEEIVVLQREFAKYANV